VPELPRRSDVIAMLATYGERQPEQVPEEIDSLELAWLIHQLEQRYGALEFDDDTVARMLTVTDVVDVLTDLKVGAQDEHLFQIPAGYRLAR
jgi:acyl carrier protein